MWLQVPPHPRGPVPPDIRRPVVPLAQLLYILPAPVLATLCASLLAERRIVLTCSDLNTLATATLAAAQILSPLRWHHVLLPVVPVAALDVLSSPIPYLVGCASPRRQSRHQNEQAHSGGHLGRRKFSSSPPPCRSQRRLV